MTDSFKEQQSVILGNYKNDNEITKKQLKRLKSTFKESFSFI